jgi:hypothetical protein
MKWKEKKQVVVVVVMMITARAAGDFAPCFAHVELLSIAAII